MKSFTSLVAAVVCLFLGWQAQAEIIRPTSVTISNRTYQLVYQTKTMVGPHATALLQDATGAPARALFLFEENVTRASIQFKTGESYTLTVTREGSRVEKQSVLPTATQTDALIPPGGVRLQSLRAADYPVATPEAPVTVDVLILYTTAAANSVGGVANLEAKAKLAVAEANQAYVDSKVYVNLNLVKVLPVDPNYRETDSIGTELSRMSAVNDGYLDNVPALRDQYGADMVCLLTKSADPSWAGIAYILSPTMASDWAYSVVQVDYLVGHWVFAHELGHNLGCNHDRDNSNYAGAFSYSYGYRFQANNVTWATVMTYPPGIRLGYFSNPDVSYLGVPVGTANENNALTINRRAAAVAAFRNPPNSTLTLTRNGSGSILANGAPASSTITASRGQVIDLTVQGQFLAWTGGVNSTNPQLRLVMSTNLSLTANFQDGTTPLAPVITAQPTSQNVPDGGNLVLSVTAYGIPAPSYTWFKDGVVVQSEGATLARVDVTPADQGVYECMVSNSAGTVRSAQALVNVGNAPRILQQPYSQLADLGGAALFSVLVDTFGVGYQWYANGQAIAGATGSILTLSKLTPSDMGTYYVLVTTPAHTVKSEEAQLLLVNPPNITQQPQRTGVTEGGEASLSVSATGLTPLTYQWQFGNANLAGETNATLVLRNAQANQSGAYRVLVGNPHGLTTSTNATVTIVAPLAITLQPADLVAARGTTPTFYVTATGSAPITYQWFCNGVALSNQVYSSCRLRDVRLDQAGNYYVVVSNPAGSVTSRSASLTVLDPPALTRQPENQSVDLGTSATFSVSATGKLPLTYQWRHRGVPVPGASQATFQIASVSAADAGTYDVVVRNDDGEAVSQAAVLSMAVPPSLTVQPRATGASIGGTVSFHVEAAGTAPLSYVWQFNGAPVGLNSDTLVLSGVQTNQAGDYVVTVRNRLGSVTSDPATLTVNDPPRVTMPEVVQADEGGTLVIAPLVSGKAPLAFTWSKDGKTLSGQTAGTLSVANAAENDEGYYTLTVANADGTASAPPVRASVFLKPRFTTLPTNTVALVGGNARFTALVRGGGPLSYQWTFAGEPIPGANTNALTLQNASLEKEGVYALSVSNRLGSITSPAVRLTVTDPPVITVQPQPAVAVQGSTVSFTVEASGRAPLSYLWKFGGQTLAETDVKVWTLRNVQPNQAGSYQVVVKNTDGVAVSESVELKVIAPPVIAVQPADLTLAKGTSGEFKAGVSSTIPCSFQWYFGNAPIKGATNAVFDVFNAQLGHEGDYQLQVSNPAGSVSTRAARLTVKDPPVFTLQPVSGSIRQGETLVLSAAASSSRVPISYQWFKNNNPIREATDATLTLSKVNRPDAGNYTVRASNSDGAVNSATAVISFQTEPPVIKIDLEPTFTLDPDQTMSLSVLVEGRPPFTYTWTFNGTNLTEATTGTLTIPSVASKHAGKYQVTITNADGTTKSKVCVVRVLALAPKISKHPEGQVAVRGSSVTFSVTPENPVGLSYQWFKDHTAIPGATQQTLTLENVQDKDQGSYNVEVQNKWGTLASAIATLRLVDLPVLIVDLQDQVVSKGASVLLSVQAQGGPDLSYRWNFNGAEVSSVTSSNYLIASASAAQAGAYWVKISNGAGCVTSRTATVTLKIPPAITVQPVSVSAKPGETATFSVTATGRGALAYQWLRNGLPLSGASDRTLILPDVQPGLAGTYAVVVTGLDGSVTSEPAVLSVENPPTITTQPQDVVLSASHRAATLSVVAVSTSPLSYQWSFNGTALAGATTSSLALSNPTPGVEGSYQVAVRNAAGTVNSRAATVRFSQPPEFLQQPSNAQAAVGGSALFAAKVSGREPLRYQWQRAGIDIPGGTSSTLALSNIQAADYASYQLLAANADGTTASDSVVLTRPPSEPAAPEILLQPRDVTVAAGNSAAFAVTVAGSSPLTYQWQFQSANLPGQTVSNLVLKGVTDRQSGSYRVIITNPYGTVTSSSASLTVLPLPAILDQPATVTLRQGETLRLAILATNTSTFHWQHGTNLIALTEVPELVVTNIDAAAAGVYTVICSNAVGAASSQPIDVTVLVPPSITVAPVPVSVPLKGTITLTAVASGTAPLVYSWSFEGEDVSGATGATLTLLNAQPQHEGKYSVTVKNSLGEISSAPVAVRVLNPPVLNRQLPSKLALNRGQTLELSVVASGRPPLSYRWIRNGTDLSGGPNSPALTLSNVQSVDAGTYSLQVSNGDGLISSQPCEVSINIAPYALNPASTLSLPKGSAITLSAGIGGTAPLAYQWKLDGNTIAGATGSNLNLTNLGYASEGVYSVAASNMAGAGTFTVALLNIKAPPVITRQPTNILVRTGQTVTCSVTADGRAPLTYQWFKNKAPISGAASDNVLTLASAQAEDAGVYYVQVSNSDGSVLSSQFTLALAGAPVISLHPKDVRIAAGAATNLVAAYTSALPVTCQWLKNGVPVPGATQTTYLIENAQPFDEGAYTLAVSNAVGVTMSLPGAVKVLYPPVVVSNPPNRVLAQGEALHLEVLAYGKEPMTYQWSWNKTLLPGITSRVLTLQNIQPSQAGSYVCTISNEDGIVSSAPASVVVKPLPVIVQQPFTTIVTVSNTMSLTVVASGPGPLVCQWLRDGLAVPGATQFSYSVTNVTYAQAGTYTALVSNPNGSVESEPAVLLVLPPQPTKIPTNPLEPAVLQLVAIPDGSVGMLFYGALGHAYAVEASADLVTWDLVGTVKVGRTPEQFIDPEAAAHPRRIYRIRLQ